MTLATNHGKEELIKKVVKQVKEKLRNGKAELVSEFIHQFLGTVSIDDLLEHRISDLYGAALSFWGFIYERQPQQTKIHIYNPDYEVHGWQSTHTIIEVIQDDMPFLVDSLLMEVNRLGLTAHLIVHVGAMKIKRDKNGYIKEILPLYVDSKKDYCEEAPIYVEVDRITDPKMLEELKNNLERVFNDVRVAVEDWRAMREQIKQAIVRLGKLKDYLDPDELEESQDYLNWIVDEHFTILGCRDYELVTEKGEQVLRMLLETGLGVLRDTSTSKTSRSIAEMTPEARKLSLSSQILIISKTNTLSTIHRPIYTDYVGIKRFNDKGEVIGERRIIGLYTSAAYNTNPKHIPFLRRKVAQIMQASKLRANSHAGKTLANILDTLPRDDLFQGSSEQLLEISMGIFHLQERRRIRLFARKDIYGRFISCLVFVPRDRFNTELRKAMQEILLKAFHGTEINFSTRFSDSVLARIHFVIRLNPKDPKCQQEVDLKAIEQKLIEIGRSWQDELARCLIDYFGEEKGNHLVNRYAHAFPVSYSERVDARQALYDVKHIERLAVSHELELNFYIPVDSITGGLRLKAYRLGETIPLSDVLPILENMGLRVISEHPFEIQVAEGQRAWINDFGMEAGEDIKFDIDKIKDKFQQTFKRVWSGQAENDGFNKLVLIGALSWQEITILRGYAKYFKQIGFTFSQEYIEEALVNNPDISKKLVELFYLLFDPDLTAEERATTKKIEDTIIKMFDDVVSLDEDRILHRYLQVIQATLRTNYFQKDSQGEIKTYLSFKLNPNAIPEMPLPLPMFEVFVYSPRFEGVHLRGGKVARGGLRWSDRREDFRTEILGLMKAQQVKNAVIVPSGAKGGFVPKFLPEGNRDAILEEGIACYKNFIRGLLDITDNSSGNGVIKPQQVVCYDDDDSYLVVAADKGTATFSDIANSISEEYNFWLGDAFASGGSAGYDHKKMGITARGAWESVKRHFRELGKDIQTTPFTVIGIGDMAGDVFGNGMLLSPKIQLVAAFNHMHIFLDPDPDPAISFKERQRLFELPRSAWSDYNEKLISKGGGIYSRQAKSIPLSAQMKARLDIKKDRMEPNALIQVILKAPVDLLWNGGIGTFVKGQDQTHTEVGDRNSDAIRVNSNELRCKVVGEGGNLGLTQLARVEYALHGGLVYADFIDNSGGVDCSDHEVNIKILLNDIVAAGDMTVKQRNKLLSEMTNEVSQLVLHHNYRQTQAISLAAFQAPRHIELHSRYIKELEQSGRLDRSLEFLPDEKILAQRKLEGKGLTRPGIAVLLAYSKIILKGRILESDVPEDPFLSNVLEQAFPVPLRKKYRKQMEQHRLRREIIATQLSNDMINDMGFAFVYRLYDETGAPIPTIVPAYTIAREIFELESIWRAIEALDNKVTSAVQMSMMTYVTRLIRRSTRWFLKNRRFHLDIATTYEAFAPGVKELRADIVNYLRGDELKAYNEVTDNYVDAGVPKDLAQQIASCRILLTALDIIEAATCHNYSIKDVASVYFAIGDILELSWIRSHIIAHPVESHWESLSREALRDDLDWQQRLLAIGILKHKSKAKLLDKRMETWAQQYTMLIERWQAMLADLRAASSMNFTMYFVAIRELLDLTQTSLQTVNVKITEGDS